MVASPSRPRFNLVELLLFSLAAAALTLVATAWILPSYWTETDLIPESAPLRSRYGPDRNSHHVEEWVIRDFFGDRRGGFFVDVGANHYQAFSNTYFLETTLGWEGIAVEPLEEFAADYATHRPRTRFRAFFVSDVSDERAKLYTLKSDSLVSSGVETFTAKAGDELRPGEALQSREVPTITLDDLLSSEGVEQIDFLSMDIELWEPKALAGFDIERFRPSLVCIEANAEVRQAILDYFTQHDYVVVARYLRADIWNLYFTPLGGSAASPEAR